MVSEAEFLTFVASVLKVPANQLSLETTYGSLVEWDSLAHLRLVMELTARFDLEIPLEDVVTVTSIWELYRRLNGLSVKKALAVDLDGTLWQGAIGEDGPSGIVPNLSFQRRLKALKDRGVLLVALSKNSAADVSFAGQLLGADDFVARAIDWNGKAENLERIARELNLALDAFVFIDDNPAERARMRALLPAVTVADFPAAPEAYFPKTAVTAEDRAKTDAYRAEAARREFAAGRDEESWLRDLEIRTEVRALDETDVARVAQLAQKANQFNVAPHRYSEGEVRDFAAAPGNRVFVAQSADRFGDMGLIGFVCVRGGEIVDWTMSCRAMGRRIEFEIEAEVERALKRAGVTKLTARWVRTGRNLPVEGLFESFGFAVTAADAVGKTYAKNLKQEARGER